MDLDNEEQEDGDGEMDKVGVRQAGGLGGDRPVARLVGLNRKEPSDWHEYTQFQRIYEQYLQPLLK